MTGIHWRVVVSFLSLAWLGLAMARAQDDQWVAVSMRQYQLQGTSRIHLYLYSFEGTFKKALTNDSGFNDLNPVFSEDGKSILFTREAADKAHASKAGRFVMDLGTGAIRTFNATNDNGNFPKGFCEQFATAFATGSEGWLNIDAKSYQSPDGRFCITEKDNPPAQGSPTSDNGHVYSVTATGKQPVLIAGLPGFIPANDVDCYESFYIGNGSPFMTGGDMEVVFLRHHLGSTDGEQVWGLDLTTMTGAKISQNGADIYHPPSAAGVFAVSQALYLPLGNTGKTVDCSYLEWWDAHLKMARYAPDLSVFNSAAIYCDKGNEAVVIRDSD